MALDNLEVGDVLINVESKANSIDKTLDNSIKQLKAVKGVLNGISNINLEKVQGNLKSISTLNLTSVAKAFDPLANVDTKKISSFNRQMRNIANLNFDNVDLRKLYNQVGTLTRIIDPFIQKIQKAEPSLKAFSNAIDLGRVNAQLMVAEAKVSAINQKAQSKKVLDDIKIQKANLGLEKTKKRLDEINEKSNKTNKTFNSIFNIGKLYFWLNYTKRITNVIVNWFNSAISFDETLNKFQVSFGEYTQEARKFANELTQAFNLSTESVLNYMATFNNMLTSLGSLSRDTATQLSETLTRMAIDYASLFNVSIETAMNQFQSVLSGSIRPIRSTSGYDVSETSIFALYQQLGGTKTMRQLSALEKRLLRILAVQKQMSETGAVEDFSKTLDNTANQLKQIAELWKEIGRWLGTLFLDYLKPIINGILTISIVIKEILKSLAIASGYTETIFEQGNGFDGLTESVSSANDEIDKLTNKLLSFDRFEALNSSEQGVSSDLEMLVNSLASYSSVLSEISSKANETAKSILQWLGFTQELNPETGELVYKMNDTYTNLEKIKDIVFALISIGLASLILKVSTSLVTLRATLIKNLTLLKLTRTLLMTGVVFAFIKFIEAVNNGNEVVATLSISLASLGVAITLLTSKTFKKFIMTLGTLISSLFSADLAVSKLQATFLSLGFSLAIIGASFGWLVAMDDFSAKTKVWVGALMTLIGVLTTATVAWLAFHSAMTLGTAIPLILAGITASAIGITSIIKGVRAFADGGYPDKGSLFIANEQGPELVGNIGGRTAVANNDMIVQAIENASYRGIVRGLATQNGNRDNIEFDFSGTNDSALARLIAQPLINELQRQGYKIEKY